MQKRRDRGMSDKMELWCQQVLSELQSGEKSIRYLRRTCNIEKNLYRNVLTNLTYMAPIYEYDVGYNEVMIGVLK
ncbi:MAG: hypothetical protein J6S85_01600 [Methanobrevibacter sp.]|nr:hypothetical protein [Methanobrevibacter sp.]